MKEKDTTAITLQAEAQVPTEWGIFRIAAFSNTPDDYAPHIAVIHPDMNPDNTVVVRVHSECMTGDIFHSKKCDCGNQLDYSMQVIHQHKGVLLYLRQEGRGIGIINKLKAYRLQEKGLNTIAANEALGLKSDYRRYGMAATMLRSLGIRQIDLMTNNPEKIKGLREAGIAVMKRIPVIIPAQPESEDYLRTKAESMGHLFSLPHQ